MNSLIANKLHHKEEPVEEITDNDTKLEAALTRTAVKTGYIPKK